VFKFIGKPYIEIAIVSSIRRTCQSTDDFVAFRDRQRRGCIKYCLFPVGVFSMGTRGEFDLLMGAFECDVEPS